MKQRNDLTGLKMCRCKSCTVKLFPSSRLATFILQASPLQMLLVLIAFELFALLPVFTAMIEGNFLNTSLVLNASHDYGYYIQFLLGFPLVLFIINKYLAGFVSCIESLMRSAVFNLSKEECDEFVLKTNRRFSGKYLQIIALSLASLITLFGLVTYITSDTLTWNNNAAFLPISIGGLLIIPVVFMLYYLAGSVLVRIPLIYGTLKDLFHYELRIQPFHPDGCGGLASLGAMSASLNFGIIILGLLCGAGIYTSVHFQQMPLMHPIHFFIVLFYLFVAVVAFFLPLRPASKKMKKAKNDTLEIISNSIHGLNTEILSDMQKNHSIKLEQIDEVSKYKEFYDMAAAMPVYPYDNTTLKSFFTSVLLPVGFFLLEYFISNYILI